MSVEKTVKNTGAVITVSHRETKRFCICPWCKYDSMQAIRKVKHISIPAALVQYTWARTRNTRTNRRQNGSIVVNWLFSAARWMSEVLTSLVLTEVKVLISHKFNKTIKIQNSAHTEHRLHCVTNENRLRGQTCSRRRESGADPLALRRCFQGGSMSL